MKKLLLALLVMPLCTFGQISLRPVVGGGYGSASQEGYLINRERTGIFIQNAGLSAVHWINNWFVSAGVNYLTTGYAYDMGTLTSGGYFEPATSLTNAKVSYQYQHVTIPVTVGRKFSMRKFSVLPEAGVDLAYNLSERSRFNSDQKNTSYKAIPGFSSAYNRVSVLAGASITASYRLTEQLSVFCGPSYKYMVTDIVKQKTSGLTGASISQNHHALLLNAGVYISLPK
jgi:hypothetical protein